MSSIYSTLGQLNLVEISDLLWSLYVPSTWLTRRWLGLLQTYITLDVRIKLSSLGWNKDWVSDIGALSLCLRTWEGKSLRWLGLVKIISSFILFDINILEGWLRFSLKGDRVQGKLKLIRYIIVIWFKSTNLSLKFEISSLQFFDLLSIWFSNAWLGCSRKEDVIFFSKSFDFCLQYSNHTLILNRRSFLGLLLDLNKGIPEHSNFCILLPEQTGETFILNIQISQMDYSLRLGVQSCFEPLILFNNLHDFSNRLVLNNNGWYLIKENLKMLCISFVFFQPLHSLLWDRFWLLELEINTLDHLCHEEALLQETIQHELMVWTPAS